MSNTSALITRLDKWLGVQRARLGEGWRELELGWNGNQIVQQYIRECGYFYSSLEDFEKWLDDYFDEAIRKVMKAA
jgi:hypothetical protein